MTRENTLPKHIRNLNAGILERLAAQVAANPTPSPATCPRCGGPFNADCEDGQGFIEVQPADETRGPVVAYCPLYRAVLETRRMQATTRGAGLDEASFTRTWGDLDTSSEAWTIARAYSERIALVTARGLNLLLVGPVGTGKTLAGVLLCKAAVTAGRTVLRVDWGAFTRRIRASYHDEELPHEDEQVQAAVRVDLLMLDDIAATDTGSQHGERLLTAILSARYDAGRGTIITANLKKIELEHALGARAFDRLTSRGDWLVFDGPAYRQDAEHSSVSDLIKEARNGQ